MRVQCVALAALLLAVPSVWGDQKVCEAGAPVNDVTGLPRRDFGFRSVSADIGDYDFYTCETDQLSGNQTCEWFFDQDGFTDNLASTSQSDSEAVVWAQSLVMYGAFAVFLLLLTTCCGLWLCCCRYCCCCCKGGGFCGKRYPTEVHKYLGYNKQFRNDGRLVDAGYSSRAKWCSRIFMWIFCAFMIIWVFVGALEGSKALTQAQKDMVNESPQPLITMFKSTLNPLAAFAEGMVGGAIATFVYDVNNTLFTTMSGPVLIEQLNCIAQLPNPPSLDAIFDFANDTVKLIDDLADIVLIDAPNAIDDALSFQDGIALQTTNLRGVVDSVDTDISSVQAVSSTVLSNITALTNFNAAAIDGPGGVNEAIADLDTISTLPDDATVQQATTDTTRGMGGGSLALASDSAVTMSVDEKNNLIARLTALNASYFALPDFTVTATEMESINTQIDNTGLPLLGDLSGSVAEGEVALNSLVGTASSVTTALNALLDTVALFNLDSARNVIVRIQDTVFAVDLEGLDAELEKVQGLDVIIPCAQTFVNEVLKINNTIIALGDTLDSVYDSINDFNVTFDDIDDVQVDIANLITDRDDLNLTSFLDDVTQAENEVRDGADGINVTALLGEVQNAEDETTAIDFTTIKSDLQTFNQSIYDNRLNQTTIDVVRSFGTALNSMRDTLSGVLADVRLFDVSGKVCAGDLATPCTATGDVACPADRCLVDKPRFDLLSLAMNGIASQAPPSSTRSDLALISTDSTVDIGVESDIQDAQASMTEASVQIADAKSQLADVDSGLREFNSSDLTAELDPINETLADISFDSVLDDIESFRDSLDDAEATVCERTNYTEFFDCLSDFQDRVQAVYDYVFLPENMAQFLQDVSPDALEAVRDADGVKAMMVRAASLVDEAQSYFETNNIANFTEKFSDRLGLELGPVGNVLDADSLTRFLEVFATPRFNGLGPVYEILVAMQPSKVIAHDDPIAKRVWKDANGVDYPNDKLCLSKACVDEEVDFLNTASIKEIIEDRSDDGSSGPPIDASRENAQLLPYLVPLIPVLFGLIASLLVCDLKWVSKLSVCMSNSMLCCIFIQVPFILLFLTPIWPLMMGSADICYGLEGVGRQYFVGEGDNLCKDVGGVGTLNDCLVEETVSGNATATFRIDILAMYDAVLGQSCSATNDPFADAMSTLGDSLVDVPSDVLEEEVLSKDGGIFGENSTIQQLDNGPIERDMRKAARTLGTLMQELTTGISAEIGCGALHGSYASLKGSFCCGVADSFYWSVGSVWLMVWTMLLCGIPAGLLGRKRLPARLWGPEYKDTVNPFGDKVDGDVEAYEPSGSGSIAPVPVADGVETVEMHRMGAEPTEDQGFTPDGSNMVGAPPSYPAYEEAMAPVGEEAYEPYDPSKPAPAQEDIGQSAQVAPDEDEEEEEEEEEQFGLQQEEEEEAVVADDAREDASDHSEDGGVAQDVKVHVQDDEPVVADEAEADATPVAAFTDASAPPMASAPPPPPPPAGGWAAFDQKLAEADGHAGDWEI